MTNRIVVSTDQNAMYSWFVPLSCLMWRDVVGFKPLVLTVGPVDGWILDRAASVGADICAVPSIDGVGSAGLAQLCRLYAYLLNAAEDDDYLLTVDIDAWPMQRAIFQPSGADLDLMYPGWCLPNAYPIGYIGAKKRIWREVMGVADGDIKQAVMALWKQDEVSRRRLEMPTADPFFNYDELLVTDRIRAWQHEYPTRLTHETIRQGSNPLPDRLDRIAWPDSPCHEGMVDAHLLRPGWLPENWVRIRPLLEQLLSPHWLQWADGYRDEWVKRMGDKA
jgi:hypothetical protein